MYHDRIRFVGALGPEAGTVGTDTNPRAWSPASGGLAGPAETVLWQGSCSVQDDVETVRKAVEASRSGRETTPADALVFLPRPLSRRVLRMLDGVLGKASGAGGTVTCFVRRLGDEAETRAYVVRTSRTDGTVLVRFA